MRKVALIIGLILVASPALAERLECDTLKASVDARLQAKGVLSYTLEIEPITGSGHTAETSSAVSVSKVNKGKVVGTCDGGTKRVIYTKGN